MKHLKKYGLFFIGVVVSLVALKFVPADIKAKIGLV